MKRILILVIAISGVVLAYGYWHTITHASAYISLALKTPTKNKQESLQKAEVTFFNSNGGVLAKGVSDEKYNFIHLIHPKVGDCHEAEKITSSIESREFWQKCYKQLSIWIPNWIRDVRLVEVKHKNCSTKKMPIVISENNSAWLLWWVPLPHVGGIPYSYFSSSIVIEGKDCIE
jgi:hypothetical protein